MEADRDRDDQSRISERPRSNEPLSFEEIKRQYSALQLRPKKTRSADIARDRQIRVEQARRNKVTKISLLQQLDMKEPKRKALSRRHSAHVQKERVEETFGYGDHMRMQSNSSLNTLSFCSGDFGENRWTIDSLVASSVKSALSASKLTLKTRSSSEKETPRVAHPETQSLKDVDSTPLKLKYPSDKATMERAGKLAQSILYNKHSYQDPLTVLAEELYQTSSELRLSREQLKTTMFQLNEREAECARLKEKVKMLESKPSLPEQLIKSPMLVIPGTTDHKKKGEEYQKLLRHSEKLTQQVSDMEEFLNDYGLVWVGDSEEERMLDFQKIVKNFHQLNAIAAQPKLIQTTTGAKFELARSIPLTLYSNGLLLGDEFRDYRKRSTRQFLKDVEDGFFPSELQTTHPDGVPFEVSDKHMEQFTSRGGRIPFQGRGMRLGSSVDMTKPKMVKLETFKLEDGKRKKKKRCSKMEDELKKEQAAAIMARTKETLKVKPTGKQLMLKIRHELTQFQCLLRIMSNERIETLRHAITKILMAEFEQDPLYKDDLDFKINVFGVEPITTRTMGDKLLLDCGITESCLVNVTHF